MPSDAAIPIQVLGRYAVCGVIGAGGMATVHIGRLLGPAGFSRTVAIKKMHGHLVQDREFVAMFLEEAHIAARVRHVNVVATLDVVSDGGQLFHVMDYVDGESFAKLLRALVRAGARTPIPVAGAVVSQALHGLHAVHETKGEDGRSLGLIHRDVSPDNILVGRDGTSRVLDFGIAKATEHGRRTQAGQVKGKVAYMAPEQLRGQPLDRRADIYAASAVLWEALTGRRLVEGDSDAEMVHAALSRPAAPPSSIVPSLPRALDDVVMRGLARDPAGRYATAREMAIAIEGVLGVASPSTVADLIEHVMGGELAARASFVDQAVRGTADLQPHAIHPQSSDRRGGVAAAFEPSALGGTEVMAIPDLLGPGGAASAASGGTDVGVPRVPTLEAPLQAASGHTSSLGAGGAAGDFSFELSHGPPPQTAREEVAPASASLGSLDVDFNPPKAGPVAGYSNPRSAWSGSPPSAGHGGSGMVGPGFSNPSMLSPKAPSTALLVPVLVAAAILVGIVLVFVLRRSPEPEAAASAVAPPPTLEETSACDVLRKRARMGGGTVGLSRAGWAVELWLRRTNGEELDPRSVDTSPLVGEGDIIELKKLNAPGKSLDEGVVVRLRGPTAESAFDEAGATRLVKAADTIFEKSRADAAALYLKCAHLPYNDVGLWFRGRDLRSASASLLFTMAMFSDSNIVRQEDLESRDLRADMPYYERVHAKLYGPRTKDLGIEIERYGATIDEPVTGGGVRITFPSTHMGDAMRASRVVADKAGIENL